MDGLGGRNRGGEGAAEISKACCREQEKAPKALSRREQNRLLRAVERGGKPRDVALIRLMLNSGLRVGEVVALKLEDIEIGERHGKVVVRSGK
ncbi:Tyrosine recombinase XerC [Neomoorella glycerini]|uniref:Tyrosine recombinase XerC n=1 Tax=Neomoorella glycerini TaxID=55779 RepID=A0A6I5ZVH6_9FIRM|nr:Tyrosine recombinase XerC [Moorella glycerini]